MQLPDIQEKIERSIYHALRYTTIAAGYIPNIEDYDVSNVDDSIALAENERFLSDLKTIKNNKGFAIELFSNGPSQSRGQMMVPRFVFETESFLPGSLGIDTSKTYDKQPDGSFHGKDNTFLSQTSDFYFQLRVITNTAKQQRVLNGIILKTFPRRGYMKWYGDTELKLASNLFINYVSHSEFNWQEEGIVEKVYRFVIPDVREIDPETMVDSNGDPIIIPEIQEISSDNIDVNIK